MTELISLLLPPWHRAGLPVAHVCVDPTIYFVRTPNYASQRVIGAEQVLVTTIATS